MEALRMENKLIGTKEEVQQATELIKKVKAAMPKMKGMYVQVVEEYSAKYIDKTTIPTLKEKLTKKKERCLTAGLDFIDSFVDFPPFENQADKYIEYYQFIECEQDAYRLLKHLPRLGMLSLNTLHMLYSTYHQLTGSSIRKNVEALMRSGIPAYHVARETNIPSNTVARLFSGQSSIDNIRFSLAERLSDYWKNVQKECGLTDELLTVYTDDCPHFGKDISLSDLLNEYPFLKNENFEDSVITIRENEIVIEYIEGTHNPSIIWKRDTTTGVWGERIMHQYFQE